MGNKVAEFNNIEALNAFLRTIDKKLLIEAGIKKIFRSPDGVYFVWYYENE